jgi:hypothetical protein
VDRAVRRAAAPINLHRVFRAVREAMAQRPQWLRTVDERNERIAERLRRERVSRGQPP